MQVTYFKSILPEDEWDTIKTQDLSRSNSTRWNSVYDEFCGLNILRAPFEDFIISEQQRAKRLMKQPESQWPENQEASRNAIFKDSLTAEDWDILVQYEKLLKPCSVATMDLQGQPGDGKSCGLANVQQDIECITEELTAAYERYKHAPATSIEGQWHFSAQIKLALNKAQEYYNKIDESPAYLAAIVLHPKYNWHFVEAQ